MVGRRAETMTAAITAVTAISPTPMANQAGLEKSVRKRSRRLQARRSPACQQIPQRASRMRAKTMDELVKARRVSSWAAKLNSAQPRAAVRPAAAISRAGSGQARPDRTDRFQVGVGHDSLDLTRSAPARGCSDPSPFWSTARWSGDSGQRIRMHAHRQRGFRVGGCGCAPSTIYPIRAIHSRGRP